MPLSSAVEEVVYAAYGAAWDLFTCDAGEVLLSGPAGTGKSRACLEKLNWLAESFPGVRLLLLRKTRRSLTESGMVTFEHKVLLPSQRVTLHHASQQYRYPNGSLIAVAGLDKPGKIMSSEWDAIYVQEATELSESDWEALTTRLRNGKGPYHQLLADCNPDRPTHWLRERANTGRTLLLESRHADNPTVTPAYLERLSQLTGVRRARLYLGLWAAAEGMVYEDAWDAARTILPRRQVCLAARAHDLFGDCGIPREWPRSLAIDFGYNNPFVCQWWARDPDGRLLMYRELYWSQRIVEDHAREILRVSGWELRAGRAFPTSPRSDPLPYAVICDHDAEDRQTLVRHLGLATQAAYKDVQAGIQAVSARLRPAGDGNAQLYLLADSLVERDQTLADRHAPTCTAEEVEGYVWQQGQGGALRDEPVKAHDHGLDALRYVVAAHDLRNQGVSVLRNVF